jgi:hypothetical protein
VPPATPAGAFVAPPPEFQFPVQAASIQRFDGPSIGDDWARFNTNNNSNTRLPARIAQGRNAFVVATAAPIVNDQSGIPSVPNQWNRINKVHAGAYRGKVGTRINYLADTDGGNSGSPVTQLVGSPFASRQAIGIHTDGLCPGTFNSGTAIDHPGLRAALSNPAGNLLPFDATVSKTLGTTSTSNNGGSDGGTIYFDITTGLRSIEVTHFHLNINRTGATNNGTTTEDDDFFNFEVWITPGTARGKETNILQWTRVALGAGMPKPEDEFTLGALKDTFTLNGSQSYGVAIVLDSGAGHAYTNGTGSNETYSNADLTITGISASNSRFGANIPGRVLNAHVGYIVNESAGQCEETIFAGNNGLNSGSTVFFDVDTVNLPLALTALSTNVQGPGGLASTIRLYQTSGSFVGRELNPGQWTLVATGVATSSPEGTPTPFGLSRFVRLAGNGNYGFALNLTTSDPNSGHAYTNGNGLNQSYYGPHMTLITGAATSGLFSGSHFTPRVWNGSLCYGVALTSCPDLLMRQEPPDPSIGGFNSTPGGQEEADEFLHSEAWRIERATFLGAFSNSPTPPPHQDMVIRFFEDDGGRPGNLIATRNISNVIPEDTGLVMAGGFNKPIYQFEMMLPPVTLPPGRHWVSALGNEPGFTWAWARTNSNANAHAVRQGAGPWNFSSGDFAFVFCGEEIEACYPDCDPSSGVGVLDIFDFLCFQNRYSANDPYACNCDNSTGPAICDIFDFLCFQNEFAGGCP